MRNRAVIAAYSGIDLDEKQAEMLWQSIETESRRPRRAETTEIPAPGGKGRRLARTLLLAAALTALLTAGAFAAEFFGAKSVIIPQSVGEQQFGHLDDEGSIVEEDSENSAALSMTTVYEGTEEVMDWQERAAAAMEEWEAYRRPRLEALRESDSAEYQRVQSTMGSFGDYPYFYGVWDDEGAAKLREIADNHGLKLRVLRENRIKMEGDSDEAMMEALSSQVCDGRLCTADLRVDHYMVYETGAFQLSADVKQPDGRRLAFYLCTTAYDEMISDYTVGGLVVQDFTDLVTRTYTAADGTELTVMQNDHQAFAFAYLDDYYLTMSMSISAWRDELPAPGMTAEQINAITEKDFSLDEEAVNAALDAFCFSAIGKGGAA